MNVSPESWALLPVSEVVRNITITDKKIAQKNYLPNGKYPVFDQGQEFIGGYTDNVAKLVECELPVIVFGDHTRVVKLVKTEFSPGADGVKILQPDSCFLPSLFEHFVRYLVTKIPNNGYARHYQHLSKSLLPIPPLAEQHRIVTKIEELFSELDKGIESLKTAQQQLKVYRQALLKHAFEGKLTAQWRADNPDKLETADALLKRIQKEREQRYQQQLVEWEATGKPGNKPRAPKPLAPLTAEELAELPELPKGWGWVRIDHIQSYEKHAVKAGPFGSALKKDFYVQGGYKVYGQEQVIRGDSEYGDYFINEDKFGELSSCSVKPFDVLISLVGTIGKVLVLPETAKPGIINPRLVKISLNLPFYRATFFKSYFESAFLRSLYATASQGTTMDILNLGIIQNLPYPICSTAEQDEVISILDDKFSMIDQLEETIATSLKQSEALRQSILKKAFCGQLVPQDPTDEPASALLARIKAEQSAAPKTKKARK